MEGSGKREGGSGVAGSVSWRWWMKDERRSCGRVVDWKRAASSEQRSEPAVNPPSSPIEFDSSPLHHLDTGPLKYYLTSISPPRSISPLPSTKVTMPNRFCTFSNDLCTHDSADPVSATASSRSLRNESQDEAVEEINAESVSECLQYDIQLSVKLQKVVERRRRLFKEEVRAA